ncbi:MAG: ABC-2 transporter permease [Ignavibacteriales bacterium]|nr:ABC-2 transporter permease [Ignavibacteriales bacterium]
MEILNLIRKDFIAGAIFLLGVAIVIPFIASIAIAAMIDDFGGIIIGIFTFIVTALCISASFIFIAIDTSFGTEMTYASLPVKRSSIIVARYMSSIIITLSGFGLVILACLSSVYIFNLSDPAFRLLLSPRGITSMISFLLFILTIMLPFVFKFGPGKGVIAALILQISLVIISPVYNFLMNVLNDIWDFDITYIYNLLHNFLNWIMTLPAIYAYLFVFGIVLTLYIISISLSIRFYNKRDL